MESSKNDLFLCIFGSIRCWNHQVAHYHRYYGGQRHCLDKERIFLDSKANYEGNEAYCRNKDEHLWENMP